MDYDHPMYRNPFPEEDTTLTDVVTEISDLRGDINRRLDRLNTQLSNLIVSLVFMFFAGLAILWWFSTR